ncbi:MAG: thiamine-phosphate kinase [Armatimonadetes bacterium]|nr:thiamine-phosphate kinase [Candidatus Hippobium faecium]
MASLKEEEFIDIIKNNFSVTGEKGDIFGIGDDCAVFRIKGRQVVTCDMLTEGTHFNLNIINGYDLGCKSALVNISDVSAMGAEPRYAFVSVGFNINHSSDFLTDFYRGMISVFDKNGVSILGGDTVRSNSLVINITLIGETDNPIMRNGAEPGDAIIISDYAGLSHAGLDALLKYGSSASQKYKSLVNAHYNPKITLEVSKELAKTGKIHSMMDLSDGICKDLRTMCDVSGVGAEAELEYFEKNKDLIFFCEKENKNIYDYLLNNFEDYTLLMTCSYNDKDIIMDILKNYGTPSCIGRITEKKCIRIYKNGKIYEIPSAWEHF